MLYQSMKLAVKIRKIKLSAEQDLYKKVEPYFFNTFFCIDKISEGYIDILLNISIKYCRYDELQYSIIKPGDSIRFTDKLRANSGVMCHAVIKNMVQRFEFCGTDESYPKLCEEILDFLERYYTEFLAMVKKEFGDLGTFFIKKKDTNPRLAGLAYLDKGDINGAISCFLHPDMDEGNQIWNVGIHTEEQRRRVEASGMEITHSSYGDYCFRTRKDQYADYAIALINGLEWNNDRAMYGLLPEERKLNKEERRV